MPSESLLLASVASTGRPRQVLQAKAFDSEKMHSDCQGPYSHDQSQPREVAVFLGRYLSVFAPPSLSSLPPSLPPSRLVFVVVLVFRSGCLSVCLELSLSTAQVDTSQIMAVYDVFMVT